MIFNPRFYRKAGWLTCFSIFLLVLAGGIVRATGSGMGCPDWPTCFGQYIPPTNADQLPENYQEIYLKKRLKKIDRYVKTLNAMGLKEQAARIANDPEIRKAETFSVVTTWIEAVNRYLGVFTGLLALLTFISSFQFIKTKTSVFLITGFGILAVVINAWMGSVVVATNLMQGPITIHYLAAFLAAGLFMWPVTSAADKDSDKASFVSLLIGLVFTLVFIQTVTGTWSRETVDTIARKGLLTDQSGHLNLSAMGILFAIHRYLSILVLALSFWLRKRLNPSSGIRKWLTALIVICGLQILAGSINILWVLPPIAQAFHIFAGGIIFGISMYLVFKMIKPQNAKD